ncbi:MAG TPA: DUF1501 domain-containing protein [Oligoflexia bacterium]|nr:DUF1501 domain-containing protein [Oligoflexia bacterium]HMP48355.1 DUF1501 domain-containing protein [Oligoflexia bacterium]
MKRITRREFIKTSATFGAYACCSAALGIGAPRLVYGQTSGVNRNMVVCFNLFGGCDDLNSFCIPFSRGTYYDIRPNIGIPAGQVLAVNSEFGFHPALQNLYSLYNEGSVGVVLKAGEPVGTRSHFTSQDIMSLGVGSVRSRENRGWIGRLGDEYFRQDQFNTFALGVGRKVDFTAERFTNPAIVVSNLASYRLQDDSKGGMAGVARDSLLQKDVAIQLYGSDKQVSGDMRDAARRAMDNMHKEVPYIQQLVTNNPPTVTYPNTRAGAYLRDVGMLARSGVGAKLAYGGMGGWDNHASQGGVTGTQSTLLSQFDAALGAFVTEMKNFNLWDKVALVVFTEFGRTKRQNTSGGTDHGWASTILVIGGSVSGGVYGDVPSNADLSESRNWIVPSTDYRNPFSEMIDWLGYDSAPIFTDQFVRNQMGLFRV